MVILVKNRIKNRSQYLKDINILPVETQKKKKFSIELVNKHNKKKRQEVSKEIQYK